MDCWVGPGVGRGLSTVHPGVPDVSAETCAGVGVSGAFVGVAGSWGVSVAAAYAALSVFSLPAASVLAGVAVFA